MISDTVPQSRAPRVSVIVPAYNSAPTIAESLGSVYAQTFQDYELIVVDDGSTDNTVEVVAGLGKPVTLLQQANRGEGGARNRGIVAARGQLLAFLDADDVWLPNYLERQIETLDAQGGQGVIFCDAYIWNGREPPSQTLTIRSRAEFDPTDPLLSIVRGYTIAFDAILCPRELLLNSGMFREGMPFGPEVELLERLARMGVPFYRNPQALVLYRYRPGSLSNTRKRESAEHLARELGRLARDRSLPQYIRSAAANRRRRLTSRFSYLAREALAGSDLAEARRCYLAALRNAPWDPRYAALAMLSLLAPPPLLDIALRLRASGRQQQRADAGLE